MTGKFLGLDFWADSFELGIAADKWTFFVEVPDVAKWEIGIRWTFGFRRYSEVTFISFGPFTLKLYKERKID